MWANLRLIRIIEMYQSISSSSNGDKQGRLIEEKAIKAWKEKHGKTHDRIILKLNILIALAIVKLLTVIFYH